jgi:molybdopterin converting factor small subunit
MSLLTLGQASKLVGKSKPTISKAVKDGKLAGQKVDGVFQIEKSELVRVYGELRKQSDKTTTTSKLTGGSAVAELEKKYLEDKVADLEARLAKAEDKVETAETREREANARVFALIEDKTPKSLMQRLLGK